MLKVNTVLVAAPGNNGIGNLAVRSENVMNRYPAIWGRSVRTAAQDHIKNLIVGGAMHAGTGKIWPKANIDDTKKLPRVFAPGEGSKC